MPPSGGMDKRGLDKRDRNTPCLKDKLRILCRALPPTVRFFKVQNLAVAHPQGGLDNGGGGTFCLHYGVVESGGRATGDGKGRLDPVHLVLVHPVPVGGWDDWERVEAGEGKQATS